MKQSYPSSVHTYMLREQTFTSRDRARGRSRARARSYTKLTSSRCSSRAQTALFALKVALSSRLRKDGGVVERPGAVVAVLGGVGGDGGGGAR
eukprot:2189198-Pleurochrysis_carterae.AAC.2